MTSSLLTRTGLVLCLSVGLALAQVPEEPGDAPPIPTGPPPPAEPAEAASPAAPAGDPGGPNRIQLLLGAELNERFWAEVTELIPVGGEAVHEQLRLRWDALEAGYGLHPMKHLRAAALIGFGPIEEPLTAMALVIEGSFDPARVEAALTESAGLEASGMQVQEERGVKVFRFPDGGSLRFLNARTALLLNGKDDDHFFALSGDGLPEPTDLGALRAHYGLAGTDLFGNVVVTPAQRRRLARSPGPMAALGPQAETVGLRVEERRLQLGATFLSEGTTRQVEGMLKGFLEMGRAQIAGLLAGSALGDPPGEGVLSLLSPELAVKRGLLLTVADWLEGIQLTRAGSSLILDLDRERVPWLRPSRLGWLFGFALPAMNAMRMLQALQSQAGRQGPPPFGGTSPFGPGAGHGGPRAPMGPMGPGGFGPGGMGGHPDPDLQMPPIGPPGGMGTPTGPGK